MCRRANEAVEGCRCTDHQTKTYDIHYTKETRQKVAKKEAIVTAKPNAEGARGKPHTKRQSAPVQMASKSGHATQPVAPQKARG